MSDDDEVPVKELRVHADTFEYTREGLQSREAIPLRTARRNKIIIVRPERRLAVGYGPAGFVLDSSFPLPASLEKFWTFAPRSAAFAHPQEPVEAPPDGYYQVYAHSSVSGDEASNKTLSDRRAAVGRALLVGDVAAMQSAADEEGWGLAEVQAMLRMLACDPGPIDGKTGDLTTAAITQFQERYSRGIYHRRSPQPPLSELEPDGEWSIDTRDAVIEAFVAAHAVHIPEDRLHPTHPANGCSEYNLLSPDDPAANRRITLLRHPELPIHHDNAPCESGNEAACAIVDDHSQRCMWFREHVIEDQSGPIYFYDPRWLWLGKNRYLLSAITNARADDEVTFEVFEHEESDAEEEDPDPFSTPRSEEIRALWRHGIVQVVWVAPGAALDERGRPALNGTPLFRVRHADSGVWTSAPWPRVVTARILVGAIGAGPGISERGESFRLWSTDGAYEQSVPLTEAAPTSLYRVALEFTGVPTETKLCLSLGDGGEHEVELFSDVELRMLEADCEEGDVCKDIPPPEPPSGPASPDGDDHADAIVRILDDDDATAEYPAW